MCLLSVSVRLDQTYADHEASLLGSHDLLYDPYDGGMATLSPERLYRNPDSESTELNESCEAPGTLNEFLVISAC